MAHGIQIWSPQGGMKGPSLLASFSRSPTQAPFTLHPYELRSLQFLEQVYSYMKLWLHFTERLYSEIHLFGACLSPNHTKLLFTFVLRSFIS